MYDYKGLSMDGFIAIAKTKDLPKLTIIITPTYNPRLNLKKIKEEFGIENLVLVYTAEFNGYSRKAFNNKNFDSTTADILSIGTLLATDGFIENNFSEKRSKYFNYGYEISINDAIKIVAKSYSHENWIKKNYEDVFLQALKEKNDDGEEWRKENNIRTYAITNLIKELDKEWKQKRISLDKEAENSFSELPIIEKQIEFNSLDRFIHFFSQSAVRKIMDKNLQIYEKYSLIYRKKLESIFDGKEYLPITVKLKCSNMCGGDVNYQVIGKSKNGTSIHGDPRGFCEFCGEEVSQSSEHRIKYITSKEIWVKDWVRKYRKMGNWKLEFFSSKYW